MTTVSRVKCVTFFWMADFPLFALVHFAKLLICLNDPPQQVSKQPFLRVKEGVVNNYTRTT